MSDTDDTRSLSFHYSDDEPPQTIEQIAQSLVHNRRNILNKIKKSQCTCDICDIPNTTLYHLNTLFFNEIKRKILLQYGYHITPDNIHRVNHLWNVFLRSSITRLQCNLDH
jgi:hypothetical protein